MRATSILGRSCFNMDQIKVPQGHPSVLHLLTNLMLTLYVTVAVVCKNDVYCCAIVSSMQPNDFFLYKLERMEKVDKSGSSLRSHRRQRKCKTVVT